MSTKNVLITAGQLRAARGLLDWSRKDLAEAAHISLETVNRAEGVRKDPAGPEALSSIRMALEAAGVEFIPENGGGAGVRLKKGHADGMAKQASK